MAKEIDAIGRYKQQYLSQAHKYAWDFFYQGWNMYQFTLNVVIHAPVSFVYSAFHEPEYLSEWFAPGDCRVSQVMNSFREGGKYRIKMLEPSGGEMGLVGEYITIMKNQKLEFSWAWEDNAEETVMTNVAIGFEQQTNDQVNVTIIHGGFSNQQECDQHQYGWMSCLQKLAQFTDTHAQIN